MKRLFLYLPVLFLTAQINPSHAQGAGTSLEFINNQNLQSATVSHNIGTGDFTWEAWIKPSVAANGTSGTGKGFMANGSYAPAFYASTGGTAPASGFGTLGIYWSGVGGTSWKNSGIKLAAGRWYHVALVRSGTVLSFYVNGIKAPNTFTINAGASMANAALRLGYSGDGSEYFKGSLDEVRIWSVARTANELQAAMCHRMSGAEPGLLLHYAFDEGAGTSLASNGALNAAITLPANGNVTWAASTAPVGDTSVALYTGDLSAGTLELGSPSNGNIKIENIVTASGGIQLYRIDTAPGTTAGIQNPGSNHVYYGLFTADTMMAESGSSYDIAYDYSNYNEALNFSSGINLYSRTNSDSTWGAVYANNNSGTNQLQKSMNANRRELILGNFDATPLPLHLIRFTAKSTGNDAGVLLNWTTANESAIDRYEVERSGDGKTFEKIAAVNALNKRTEAGYAYTDQSPLQGDNFYRIRQVDNDGTATWSFIAKVSFHAPAMHISLSPNPAKDVLTLHYDTQQADLLDIQIYDLNGKALAGQLLPVDPEKKAYTLSLSNYNKGVLLLSIKSKNQKTATGFRIIKN